MMLLIAKIACTILVLSVFSMLISSALYDDRAKVTSRWDKHYLLGSLGYYGLISAVISFFVSVIALIWSDFNV